MNEEPKKTPFKEASDKLREVIRILENQYIEAGIPENFFKGFPYLDFPMTMYMKDWNGDSIPIKVTPCMQPEPTLEELQKRIALLEIKLLEMEIGSMKTPLNYYTYPLIYPDVELIHKNEMRNGRGNLFLTPYFTWTDL